MNCLKCNHDITDFMDFDNLQLDFIECPNCNNKMIVLYDDGYDEETETENEYWWVEQYK